MPKRSSKLDLNQLAKRIVDEATGEAEKTFQPPEKNKAAVELGRLGGKKGGKRADSLHSIDRFFMELRRRMSLFERPIATSSAQALMVWLQPIQPRGGNEDVDNLSGVLQLRRSG